MIRHILLSVLALAAVVTAAPPLVNQVELRIYTGAGMRSYFITPVPGRALGMDLNGNWAMLATGTGGATGVTSVALAGGQGITVTGDSPIVSTGAWTLGVDPVPLKTTLALENVENTALSTWAGSTNLTTLGTIAVGTWQGAAIGDAFIASAAAWNAKQDGSTKLTSIASLSLTGQTGKFLRVNAAETGYELVAQAAPVWGNITGLLSAQTDLQAALNAKADDADLSAYLTTTAAAAGYQPLDADLTSIAALTTTAFGRGILTETSAASLRGTLELGTLATQSANISDYLTTAAATAGYQPLNANLTSIGALTTTAFGRGLLTEASAASTRTTLELGTLATQSANISDYLTAAAAALTYQPLSTALTTFATNGSAFYLSRANHTGTQAWSTLTGTPTTLAGYGITDGITAAAVAAGYQPLDADLTSISALATTAFGRGILTEAGAASLRSTLGLGTLATQSANISDYLTTTAAAAGYQPLDTDLTSIAALTTTAFGRGILTLNDAAAGRSAFELGTLATQSANISDYLTAVAAASSYQPLDADLTSIAALTTTAFGRGILTKTNAASLRSTLELGTLATQSANISDYLTTAAATAGYQPLNSILTSVAGLGPLTGQAGKILRINATETGVELYAVTGAGTVTSVALSLPASVFSVSGSPVTAAGTLTATLVDQAANLVWASPASGPAGPPTFRSLADADLPAAVVRTTGSYADPAWITSLAQSKVGLSNVENTALSTWTGSTNLATLGTITAGTWQGAAIGDAYISSAATWSSKQAGSSVLTNIAGLTLTGQSGKFLRVNAAENGYELATSTGSGTVTSVALSGGTTGLTTSGGPITTSGTITLGGTLAVANGGTGSTTESGARTALGVAIGSDVQAYDAQLTDLAGLAPTKGRLIVGDGTNWVDLGVGTDTHVLTADSAQAKGLKWAAPTGGGGSSVVLEVKTAAKTDTETGSGNNGTWNDVTGLSISVTTSAGERVVLSGFVSVGYVHATSGTALRLVRAGTPDVPINVADDTSGRWEAGAGPVIGNDNNAMFSAVVGGEDKPGAGTWTYKVQACASSGTGSATWYVNRSSSDSNTNPYSSRAASFLKLERLAAP